MNIDKKAIHDRIFDAVEELYDALMLEFQEQYGVKHGEILPEQAIALDCVFERFAEDATECAVVLLEQNADEEFLEQFTPKGD